MTTKTNNMNIDEFAAKVMEGMKRSNRKLVETAAANGRSLIVEDKDGSFKAVPAKDLLKTLPPKEA